MSRNALSPDSLPDNCKAILYALVTAFPGKGKNSLLKLLRTLGICDPGGKLLDSASLPGLLQLLQSQGWVEVEQRNEGQYFVVAAHRRNSVLLSLLSAADGTLRLQQLSASLPALVQWQVPGIPRALQELWLSLLSGDSSHLQQSLHLSARLLRSSQWVTQHPMRLLQSDPAGLEVFGRLD
jgi:hypothetical protein